MQGIPIQSCQMPTKVLWKRDYEIEFLGNVAHEKR